jgi:hypothetical protein
MKSSHTKNNMENKIRKAIREEIKKLKDQPFPAVGEGMDPEEWEAAKEKDRLDQHPEKDTIKKIKQMMDKEKSLKEKATELGYLGETGSYMEDEANENGIEQIQNGINQMTVGFKDGEDGKPDYLDKTSFVSDGGDKIKIEFGNMDGEFTKEEWGMILNYLSSTMEREVTQNANYYEPYDRGSEEEYHPYIYLKK